MKYLKLLFVLLIFTCFFKNSHAQNIDLISGDITVLKGQPSVMITFVYDNMKIGEFTEEMYFKQKKSEYRKAPDAEKFIAQWKVDFKDKHEPKFIEQFNNSIKKLKLKAVKDDTSKYTLIVNTNKIEPGYYKGSGSISRETYIDVTVDLVESNDPTNILATIKAENVVGVGINTTEMKDQQSRIANAYGDCASRIAKLIVKLCK